MAGVETSDVNNFYDLVILGASGFTGKYVIKEALKFLNAPSSPLKTLALAGRSPSKLQQALKWASQSQNTSTISILNADITDPLSLRRLCAQTKLVLNCVGPFRLYGEPVVAACIESGVDYLDICGEPEFIESIEARFHEQAVETSSLVISACGFDSVPAELGCMFNSKQWVGPSAPNRIDAYLSLESERRIVGNFATFESAVLGVANTDKLQGLRRSRPKRSRPLIPGHPPLRKPLLEHQEKIGLWAVWLPSADASIVRRTMSTLSENPCGLPGVIESPELTTKRETFWSSVKPAHFGVKLGAKSLFSIFRFIAIGVFIGVLGKIKFGRWLLFKFPSVFSFGWFRKNGPSEDEVKSASFKMWFVGQGFKDSSSQERLDTEIITRVMGPEIGYLVTPIILLQCSLLVLSHRENLPRGGVLSPGIVFGAMNLQERLQENGISFDFISKSLLD